MPSTKHLDVASGSTALLTIDLEAIGANYTRLSRMGSGAECAGVVKANAYGTGAHRVAPYLYDLGCRTFFVATLAEGIHLRGVLADAKIFILDGLFSRGSTLFEKHRLSPVLGSLQSLAEWSDFCGSIDNPPPAALHIDTGMNRLGVGPDEIQLLFDNQQRFFNNIKLDLIMSHLACADTPSHPRNQQQLEIFKAYLVKLPPVPASLANSAGIFLGSPYQHDLLRPGIALYGGCAVNSSQNPMRPVVTLTTHIVQIRTVEKGDFIGYGGTYQTTRKTRLATLPIGYADGYHRALGSSNEQKGASAYIGAHEAPLLGRVSMDLVTIDITDIPPDSAMVGTDVELLGAHVTVDDLAELAGTIGYEILTSLGKRYDRRYTDGV
jgi:alanine racemase